MDLRFEGASLTQGPERVVLKSGGIDLRLERANFSSKEPIGALVGLI